MPRGVFDYVDGGAEDERALAANSTSLARTTLRPRVLCDVSAVDTSTTLLGRPLPLPLVLGPTGFTRIVSAAGELDVARASARAGLPYTLSTLGTRSIEEVRAVSAGPLWFQVYVWRDRGLVADMVRRAAEARYDALMITLHPAWTWEFVRSDPIRFANVAGLEVGDGSTAVSLADYVNAQFDPGLSWRDLEWFRSIWDGPIVLKGIQTVEDAVLAADAGVDAISLSNHGGRQLDAAPAIYDGGIRRGSDIVKAVAAGAKAASIGRAYLYGLGAAGERGVDHALELLRAEMTRTMALAGVTSVSGLGRALLG